MTIRDNFHDRLNDLVAATFGQCEYVLAGRGTTALWLALQTIARRDGPGEVILPDMLCSSVLDGVLLAGFTPIFAEVSADRFSLSPEAVARHITRQTRAVLVAHLFGHRADIEAIRANAPGLPIIEDAVQGFGGQQIGTLGDLSFVSFDETKMVGGRGGLLLIRDAGLIDGIRTDLQRLTDQLRSLTNFARDGLNKLLPAPAAHAYAAQLQTFAPRLLIPFNPAPSNLERIVGDWQTLAARVIQRNEKAAFLRDRLRHLPLSLPAIADGDAIWRYTIVAPSVIETRRIIHAMQRAGLNGSSLYPPFGSLFGQHTATSDLSNRLINLWVDSGTTERDLQRTVEVIASAFQGQPTAYPGLPRLL